ncbi:MAG: rhodanese-like domain-containing protein [Deltaproteobacteria bacterium]|nr:rhodanese-like domain-containing protein [Deltaproteobacteria bacterium]
MKQALTALFLVAGGMTFKPALVQASEHAAFAEVSTDELDKLVSSKAVFLIDANGAKTYAKGHIPGAINFAANEDKLATVLPKDKSALIVAYCGGPLCSAWEAAAAKTKDLGYANIKHYKGGIKVWKEAGKKVDSSST